MKCSYHPAADSQDFCSTCSKALCGECSHQIKAKIYCQDCLVRGAEWAASVKDLHIPVDSPKRAAVCSLIPGMGAVYNGEYMKAITYFAVFAALVIMADDIHGVFALGAVAFVVFTMFDSYRTAQIKARARLESGGIEQSPVKEGSNITWGIFLIVLGVVFLLQNIIPYYFLNRLWPLVFIGLGGYLVYYAMRERDKGKPLPTDAIGDPESKESL